MPPMTDMANKLRGRASLSNQSSRYLVEQRQPFDDGWETERPDRLATRIIADTSKKVISYNKSPDLGFDRTINPYQGCEHGCIYCYARPTHAYWGYSPGQDFETVLFAKHDASSRLQRELAAKNYKPATIVVGANTDAYQPIERELNITRNLLKVLLAHKHPTSIVTKSALIQRDADLWAALCNQNIGHVTISVTTLDRKLARTMEPRAATPGRRIETIKRLAAEGVLVCVNVAPIIPGLTDHEIEPILEAAKEAGAKEAAYTLIRLPLEIKDLFFEWMQENRPERRDRVESLIRQIRGGALYRSEFGERMHGTGPLADLIQQRFNLARKRLGLSKPERELRNDLFQPPKSETRQLSLEL